MEKQTTLFGEPTDLWDFPNADTQYLTHGLHPYPARMIPQIARELIQRYLLKKLNPPYNQYIILDPFCGSGTVLVEAKLLGVNAVGSDINPLAILLAKVKSQGVRPELLEKLPSLIKKVEKELSYNLNVEQDVPEDVKYWFKPNVIRELLVIKHEVENIEDRELRGFLKVCLSLTARKVSNIYREGDTYIKRMNEEDLKSYNPNVIQTFNKILRKKVKLVKDFWRKAHHDIICEVIHADTLTYCIKPESVDLIVTSPPYGEEKNTVSYTRWSKISLYWIGSGIETQRRLKRATLGFRSSRKASIKPPPSETLLEVIEQAKQAGCSDDLVMDVYSFFDDYYKSLKVMFTVLKRERFCCIVIGNRSVKQKRIPMDKVTIELAEKVGFIPQTTYYRRLPTKALPWRCGKGETISKENIIILKKE